MNRTESDYTERGHLLIEILRRELAEFIKEIGLKEIHLEKSRMELAARYNNSINQLFVHLDTNRKGYVDSTDLQIFLMNHKHYFEQQIIHKFVKKYAHNNMYLDVNEFYKLLLPRNRYEALSSSLRYKEYEGPCKKIAIQLMLQDVSKLIKNQILTLKYFIEKKNELIKYSLRNGTTLWRLIDKQFQNILTYEHTKKFLNYFKIDFTEMHWLAFLQYCTEIGKKVMSMHEFLVVFNPEQFKKENFAIEMKKLEYPFEPHRVQLQIQRDWRQQDWKKRTQRIRNAELQAAEGIVEEGKLIHKQYSKKDLARTLSTTGGSGELNQKRDLLKSMTLNKSIMKSILKQEHLPVYDLNNKRLMKYRDLGYRNTNNHIKAWK